MAKNRTRHLKCSRSTCEEFTVLHLGFLDYAHYVITVKFFDLGHFHQRYHINELKFYVRLFLYKFKLDFLNLIVVLSSKQFKTYNPAFTQIEIWFRFIFLFSTFVVTCWYAHTLRKYPMMDWSIEQRWVALLLPLLVLYNSKFSSHVDSTNT